MKFSCVSTALAALAASSVASAAAVPRSTDQLTCTYDSSQELKWTSIANHNKWGYLSFSNRKDDQGRPIATTLEKNGKPAKPVKFDFLTCAAPNGKPGYMGFGSGKLKNGKHVGHVRLQSDHSKCLAVDSIKSETHLVLEDCNLDDNKVQRYQFFGPSINYITMGLQRNPYLSNDTTQGNFFVNQQEAGKPFKLVFNTSPSKDALYWNPRPEA